MKNEELRGAFSRMQAPDACVEKVLAMQSGEKRMKHGAVVRRIVAAAAALVLITGGLFFLDKLEKPMPFFTMYVYANETDTVELGPQGEMSVLCEGVPKRNNETPEDPNPFPGNLLSPIVGADNRERLFMVNILYTERTKGYTEREIFCNGENIINQKNILIGFSGGPGDQRFSGFFVAGTVETVSVIDVFLYGEEGELLQKYSFTVTPLEEGYRIDLGETYVKDEN